MTDGSLGTWRHPPLAYVVAELAISPHYTLKAALPALQAQAQVPGPLIPDCFEAVACPIAVSLLLGAPDL